MQSAPMFTLSWTSEVDGLGNTPEKGEVGPAQQPAPINMTPPRCTCCCPLAPNLTRQRLHD